MPDTTISGLPAAASANSNAVVAADNAAGTLTEKVTLGQISTLAAASAPVQSVAGKTGTVTLVPSDVGAAAASHTHAASDVTSGTFAIGLLPTGTTASTVCIGNDSRLSDSRTPTGAAGGSLAGTFPNPTIAASGVTAGTYQAVTVGTDGRVTAGSNPTTLAGYGITDAAASIHVHAGSDITSGTVSVARLPTVLEKTVTVGNSGTSTTLSLASGSFQTVTLNGNCTFTMPSASAGASLTLILTQSGAFTATFTGVIWSNGAAPVITPTATKRDILVFVSDGTNWFGSFTQNF